MPFLVLTASRHFSRQYANPTRAEFEWHLIQDEMSNQTPATEYHGHHQLSRASRYSPRSKLLVLAVWWRTSQVASYFLFLTQLFFSLLRLNYFAPRFSPRPKCSMIYVVHRTGATRIGKYKDVAMFKNAEF